VSAVGRLHKVFVFADSAVAGTVVAANRRVHLRHVWSDSAHHPGPDETSTDSRDSTMVSNKSFQPPTTGWTVPTAVTTGATGTTTSDQLPPSTNDGGVLIPIPIFKTVTLTTIIVIVIVAVVLFVVLSSSSSATTRTTTRTTTTTSG
jgi:hypothetical protein